MNSKVKIVSAILALALVMMFGTMNTTAATTWSDDFNDQDYDGWTVASGGFSAVNSCLECTEFSVPSIGSKIWRSSDVNSGTWSFDGYFVGASVLMVYFWSSQDSTAGEGYAVGFYGGSIVLNKIGTGQLDQWVGGSEILLQWVHLDVTMDESFVVDVYFEGTHIIHRQVADPFVTSEYFGAGMNEVGNAIDNVVVSDTIDVECTNDTCTLHPEESTTTTTTTSTTTTTTITTEATPPPAPALPLEMIALAGGVAVVLVVIVVIMKRK